MLDGYKTYVFTGLLALSGVLFALGYVDETTLMTLITIFGAGSVYGLRAKKE